MEETNRAKALIEDFMIGANGVTARYLEARGYPSLRRILRSPERWERILELSRGTRPFPNNLTDAIRRMGSHVVGSPPSFFPSRSEGIGADS